MKPSSILPIGLVSAFLLLGWCITHATAHSKFQGHLNIRGDVAGDGGDATGDVDYENYGGPVPENHPYDYAHYYTTYGYGPPYPPPPSTPTTSSSSLTSSSTSMDGSLSLEGSTSSSTSATGKYFLIFPLLQLTNLIHLL